MPYSRRCANALGGRSIASRLFLSAAFWSTLILALAGLGLSALNARWTEANFDDQLGVYLKALIAKRVPKRRGERARRRRRVAPQFELAFSGWYWQITRLDANPPEIRASKSLFATQLPHLVAINPDHGEILSGYVIGPGGRELRMVEREIDAGDEGRYLVQVAANADVIQAQERSFEWALAATFLTLALALIGSTGLAVRYGLRPLRALRDGVAAIRRGEAEHIAGEFPQDVAPLAAEVNQLIDANREIVERARTQVGNLAHALKTPLSVLINEAEFSEPEPPAKGSRTGRNHAPAGRRSISIARVPRPARATVGVVTDVKPVVEGLVRTFEKLHAERGLTFTVELQDGLRFRGEQQDLTDLIGNLLDNAGKWARETVSIRASRLPPGAKDASAFLVAEIDDDGPGLDPSARAEAIERGRRLDEVAAGLRARPFDRRRSRGELRRLVAARRKSARRPARGPAAALRLICCHGLPVRGKRTGKHSLSAHIVKIPRKAEHGIEELAGIFHNRMNRNYFTLIRKSNPQMDRERELGGCRNEAGIFVALALNAPILAGCASFGFGGEAAPGKPSAAAAATPPRLYSRSLPSARSRRNRCRRRLPTPQLRFSRPRRRDLASPSPRRNRRPRHLRSPPRRAAGAAPAIPTGAALGGVLGGPIGASLTEADRQAAWNAQIAALDSGQSRSWRGVHGVFGFVAPGAETGGGCRAYSQTIYVAGRPNRGRGVACKQADGTWKMTS